MASLGEIGSYIKLEHEDIVTKVHSPKRDKL
jgi:hypothetical protein